MNQAYVLKISEETGHQAFQVEAAAQFIEQGATIPFIARYRKEATGSLDEVSLTVIRNRLDQLVQLDERKGAILKSLENHGHLNEQLEGKVNGAQTLSELEDIYLPYRPKRRTKGAIAVEKGLKPLAEKIFEQKGIDPLSEALFFIHPEKGVDTAEDALAGARDIIAEMINENSDARAKLRELFMDRGVLRSRMVKGKEQQGAKFRDYFEWEEPLSTAPSHRVLAMRRGEKQDILNLTVAPDEQDALEILTNMFIRSDGPDSEQVLSALKDSYTRLLSRSMETEARLAAKEKADGHAIGVFAENLRQLLMAPPLGDKRVMGVDPGFRTGCKIVCLDPQGALLCHDTIYLHQPEKAAQLIEKRCSDYSIEAIAVGNGTAGRETETFLKSISIKSEPMIIMVDESGASIYSASETARKEFPDLDITVRGAVSIGRRLMDPLSELVKIEPKSIGVGQYQHDVDQAALKKTLDDVVISCVNAVGVDVNRASVQLLTYISGLGQVLAQNIVSYRNEKGPFKSRTDLLDVKRLGPKAFEQCAGFLRISKGTNPLDASAVHPESYPIVDAMAHDLGCPVSDLIGNRDLLKRIDLAGYVSETVGLPTLDDIIDELSKPGRDPRQRFEEFTFDPNVARIEDLKPGMKLPGVVTNITAFGAFVDIGVHQDGLVHISEMADQYVSDPSAIVKLRQHVSVRVLEVDLERMRISLSMKSGSHPSPAEHMKRNVRKIKNRRRDQPFNNPFADAFKKRKD